MIRLHELSLPPEHTGEDLKARAAKLLRMAPGDIETLTVVRRSIDARKKPAVQVVYTVDVAVRGDEQKILRRSGCKKAAIASTSRYTPPAPRPVTTRPVVVGFGPAGMFAALVLALAGQKPLVLERGEDAITRKEKVEHFFQTGELDEKSNVQFGEGGAGTFSDGKLNTGVNNPRISWILEQFVAAGANEDILYDAKPHVGTDILVTVVQNLRRRIEDLGGQVRFCAQVTDMLTENGRITGVEINGQERLPCSALVLAIGHSARDTFQMLLSRKVPMEPKPFAMGVRIEHRQEAINAAQYGKMQPGLPPADYKIVRHFENRAVYSFCMCPGGYVVAAASEKGGVVTNGMSNQDRGGENANAALLVTVTPADFPEPGVLGGMQFQRALEQKAFELAGNTYRAPAQRVGDFLAHRRSLGAGSVTPTYRPGVSWCDLHDLLPAFITRALEQEIPAMERHVAGFASPDAVLTGPETRSSSPVRILRGETRQSAVSGLYPCGEGAGYAGGIMSAAIDGMLTAEALLENL